MSLRLPAVPPPLSLGFSGGPEPGVPPRPPPTLGPKLLASWEPSEGMWAAGPGAPGPPTHSETNTEPHCGPASGPIPRTPESLHRRARARARPRRRRGSRPPSHFPGSQPSPPLAPTSRPLCAQAPRPRPLFPSHKAALVPGRGSPPPGLCPRPPSAPTQGSPQSLDPGHSAASSTSPLTPPTPNTDSVPARWRGRGPPGPAEGVRLPGPAPGSGLVSRPKP